MKLSVLTLATIALAVTSVQSASAQETRGARFNYAPNRWKSETAPLPKGYGEYAAPAHNVRAGAVPSSNMLGLDPAMLERPAPPPPIQQVAARPATTSVTPSWSVPKTNASFNPAFGRPQSVVAQSMPAAMPAPGPALAKPQAAPVKPAVAAPIHVARHRPASVHTGVSGRLMRPHMPTVSPASATPAVASYGKNFGYTPGPYMPTSSGAVGSGEVRGRLLTKTSHH